MLGAGDVGAYYYSTGAAAAAAPPTSTAANPPASAPPTLDPRDPETNNFYLRGVSCAANTVKRWPNISFDYCSSASIDCAVDSAACCPGLRALGLQCYNYSTGFQSGPDFLIRVNDRSDQFEWRRQVTDPWSNVCMRDVTLASAVGLCRFLGYRTLSPSSVEFSRSSNTSDIHATAMIDMRITANTTSLSAAAGAVTRDCFGYGQGDLVLRCADSGTAAGGSGLGAGGIAGIVVGSTLGLAAFLGGLAESGASCATCDCRCRRSSSSKLCERSRDCCECRDGAECLRSGARCCRDGATNSAHVVQAAAGTVVTSTWCDCRENCGALVRNDCDCARMCAQCSACDNLVCCRCRDFGACADAFMPFGQNSCQSGCDGVCAACCNSCPRALCASCCCSDDRTAYCCLRCGDCVWCVITEPSDPRYGTSRCPECHCCRAWQRSRAGMGRTGNPLYIDYVAHQTARDERRRRQQEQRVAVAAVVAGRYDDATRGEAVYVDMSAIETRVHELNKNNNDNNNNSSGNHSRGVNASHSRDTNVAAGGGGGGGGALEWPQDDIDDIDRFIAQHSHTEYGAHTAQFVAPVSRMSSFVGAPVAAVMGEAPPRRTAYEPGALASECSL